MKKKTILLIFLSVILFFSGLSVSADSTGVSLQTRFNNPDFKLFDTMDITYFDPNGNQITEPTINTTLKMSFNWTLSETEVDLVEVGDFYEFELPAELKITENLIDAQMGNFAIYSVTTDNKVKVTFVNSPRGYIDVHGSLKMEASLNDDGITSPGPIKIKLPVKESLEINLNLKPKSNEVAISKQGEANQTVNTKSIKWTVLVNGNLQSLTDVTIKDILPATLTADLDSFVIREAKVDFDGKLLAPGNVIDAGLYTFDKDTLSYSFATLDKAVVIEFNSIVKDEALTPGVISEHKFINEATLSYGDNKSIKATATVISSFKGMSEKKRLRTDQTTRVIDWEVSVNGREKTLVNPSAVDTYDSKLEYVTGTLKVYKANGELLEAEKYEAITDVPSKITVNFKGTISEAYTIKYSTHLKNTVDVTNEVTVNNSVVFESVTSTGSGKFTQQVIEKNVGSTKINYQNRTIPWEILINKNKEKISNLVLTDTFDYRGLKITEAGIKVVDTTLNQDLVLGEDYTLTITKDSVDNTIETGFVITFSEGYNPTNHQFKITYETYYDYNLLQQPTDGSNLRNIFKNTASLLWDSENKAKNTSSDSAEQVVNDFTVNNGSKAGQYNAVSKEITWTINLNYNAEQFSEPFLSDPINNGQTFLPESLEVWSFRVNANGDIELDERIDLTSLEIDYPSASNNYTLHIELPTGSFQKYQVKFNVSIEGAAISNHYDNVAQFSNGSVIRSLNARVEVVYGKSIVEKSGKQTGDYIDWSVVINHSQSTLQDVSLLDIPSKNQILDQTSFKIYPVVMNADESYTVDRSHPLVAGQDYALTFFNNENGIPVFTLTFNGTINRPYVLEYRAQIFTTEDNLNISNKIELIGNEITYKPSEETQTIKVNIGQTTGWAVGVKSSFRLLKTGVNDTPLQGVTFALYNSNNVLIATKVTDETGIIHFTDLLRGNYTLKEVSTVPGYVIPAEYYQGISIQVNENTSKDDFVYKIENEMNQFEVVKKNRQGDLLEDAVFTLEKLEGAEYVLVASDLTTVSGKFVYAGLSVGSYRLTETQAPAGYVLNTQPVLFEISADSNGQAINRSLEVINEQGSAQILKLGADNTPLEGVYFDVFKDGTLIKSNLVTDPQGIAKVSGLAPGNYTWVEKSSVAGYIVNSTPQPFTIAASSEGTVQTVETTLVNHKARIVFVKEDQHQQPLAGAIFNLLNEAGTTVQTSTSQEDGSVVFENVIPGKYSIVESQAKKGYVRNTKIESFTVALSTTETQLVIDLGVFVNGQGSVELTKQNDLNEALAGVQFRLEGETLAAPLLYTTNAYGKIMVDGLAPGDYQFVEVSAPDGYIVNPTPLKFTVVEAIEGVPSTILLDATNSKAHLFLVKEDAQGAPLEGAVFGLYKSGTDELLQRATSDDNGRVDFLRVAAGSYEIREMTAVSGYVQNTRSISVTVPDSAEAVVELDLGTFINYQGSVRLVKTNDEQVILPGVVFELFTADSVSLGQYTTNDQGEISVDGLAPGNYIFKEISSVDGYVVDSNPISFTIVDQALEVPEVVQLTLSNSRGEIIIHKVDNYGKTLSGAYFGLFVQGEQTPLQVIPSDQNGLVRFQKVAVGTYEIREMTALDTYILNTQVLTVEVPESSDKLVSLDLGDFVNYQGQVQIRKVDPQGNLLKEATFDLYHTETGRWERNLSTQEGLLLLDNLAVGHYQLFEVTSPRGYSRQQTPVEFTIDAAFEGVVEVIEIEVVNTPHRELVNTGVGLNPWPLLLSILGIASIWMGVFLKHIQKKKIDE